MFLDELNESQRQAVECLDAPSLVIAGAGSGKTRVLTYKIAYLLERDYRPWEILALTFTNKAAREMQQRISTLVGNDKARYLWMGTFHSIFSRILRTEASVLGFTSDFTIYDATDSKSLVKGIIREMGLDDKTYKPGVIAGHISSAKNSLIVPAAYRQNSHLYSRDQAAKIPLMPDIYERYCQRCRQSNAMDFDDLLLYTYLLFQNHPDVLQKYRERFHYVLVDEYQDTNYAQHQIVWQLTAQQQHVCVVGDDAQSIYSFRGANIDNILKFQSMYKGAKLFKLEQNYRSSQVIVSAANSLIHHNVNQIRKEVFSKQEVGQPIELCVTHSDIEEAIIVSRKIRHFVRDEHLTYNQIAVLYRTNAQSRSIEEALRKDALPYRIYGGLSFYQRKEIKDVIAYFRLAVNPRDEEALKRVINYPARGIGNTSLSKIFATAVDQNVSPWDIVCHPESSGITKGTQNKMAEFVQMINDFHEQAEKQDAHVLGLEIIKRSGVQGDIFSGHEPDDISRQENLQELMDGISAFVETQREQGEGMMLTNYLQEVSLLSDMDEDDSEGDDKVTLMTVHSAKGLEFGAVIVVGMEENLFPSQMSMDDPRQIEEERRLFYVAMTRAKHFLVLTCARSRFKYGQTEFSNPSRFLGEIDKRYLTMGARQSTSSYEPEESSYTQRTRRPVFTPLESPRPERIAPTITEPVGTPKRLVRVRPSGASSAPAGSGIPDGLHVGCKIEHDRFGRGEVVDIAGSGLDAKATVRFENVGQKQLLLRFAKFKVIG